MKKKLSLMMALVSLVSMFSAFTASAAMPNAYYNDVRTFINNYPVESFTINNHAVVSTDDIKDFGFRVVWDGNARAVYISKDAAKNAWNPTNRPGVNYKAYAGEVAFKTVPTDIKVYVNAQLVDSYNNGAETFINLGDLTKASCKHSTITKQWFADERQSFLWISSEAMNGKTQPALAYLTCARAYELAVKAVAKSIYAEEATVVPVYMGYGASDKDYIDANGGYTFDLKFTPDVDAVTTITVAKDGSTTINGVPAWLEYICK